MKVYNKTKFNQEEIASFTMLGKTISNWRKRTILLYQHPVEQEKVVSVGETFDQTMMVIVEETKLEWATALDYAARGKIYESF